uniref:Amphi-Trp domain-containing protein n=1 Tax=Ammonifex degensii TaxID=42838 RepID=A0A7C2IPZ3_9THEO
MKTEQKIFKRLMSREELVSYLEGMLAEIKEGRLTAGDSVFTLPQVAEMEIEIEEKKGRKLELEIEWHLESGSSGTQGAETKREEDDGE